MNFSKPPTFQVTPYGDVDAMKLETLRDAYDTTALLALVEHFDRLRPLFSPDGGIRDELLHLHAMAHTVINDGPLSGTANGTDIWEAAQDLIDELFGVVGVVHAALETLQPLADLAPIEE